MIRNRKIVLISIILITIFSMIFCKTTYATDDLLDDLDYYKPGELGKEEEFTKKVGVLLGTLNLVGVITSVVTIMIIGFKYMIGSVEDRAGYKKTMIPWIIGAVLVFSVTTIPNLLYNVGTSLSDDTPKSNGGGYINNDSPKGNQPGKYFESI